MKMGKISESILKRSVLKQIKPNREELIKGAAVGTDCAFIHADNSDIAVATGYTAIDDRKAVIHAIQRACNNLAAGGADLLSIQLHISLPETYFESDLKEMMKQAQETAQLLNIQITGGHTETVSGLKAPIISVTALGTGNEHTKVEYNIHPGQDIVMTKWMGLSGTSYLATEKEKELLTKFPSYFVKDAQALEQYYSIVPEAATARKSGVSAMHDISGGGVFGALWELGEHAGVGLTISLKKIPVKQETIEICEFYDLNPYELRSDGSLLVVCDDGYALVTKLMQQGIAATVIGRIEEGNDRVVLNEDEKRFLEPPRKDELLKVL